MSGELYDECIKIKQPEWSGCRARDCLTSLRFLILKRNIQRRLKLLVAFDILLQLVQTFNYSWGKRDVGKYWMEQNN